MKYGINNWSRISTLLYNRTSEECKTRWNEWLDPNIRKIEWTIIEDEKLLNMAKLMPSQWKTISQTLERTATQCQERYEQLIDKAKNYVINETKLESKSVQNDRNTSKNEQKMISENRDKLYNTRAKKGESKAREQQIEIARQLAVLEKRRELKAELHTKNGKKFNLSSENKKRKLDNNNNKSIDNDKFEKIASTKRSKPILPMTNLK